MSNRSLEASNKRHFSSRKTQSGLKIAFVHNRYIGYRLPFFEKLAKLFDIRYFFDQVDPKTNVQGYIFSFNVLRSYRILHSPIYDVTWSPMLPYHLLKGKYSLFIGADLGQPGTYVAFLVAKLLRKPFILCNEGWDYTWSLLRSLRHPVLNVMMHESNALVVPGTKAKEFFLSCGVDPEKIFIAPNASICLSDDSIAVRKGKLKEILGIRVERVVLYLGRLVRSKGLCYLIEAFAKLQEEMSNVLLLIAGEGEAREELEKLCLARKINSMFLPATYNGRQKALYFSLADIVVLPSVRTEHYVDVWGLALNEAMSVGKPVISTTAVGAAYDLIENGVNGYVVKEEDVRSLFDALRKMLLDSEKLGKMGIRSKKTIERSFTYDHMTQGFAKAIQYVTNSLHKKKARA